MAEAADTNMNIGEHRHGQNRDPYYSTLIYLLPEHAHHHELLSQLYLG